MLKKTPKKALKQRKPPPLLDYPGFCHKSQVFVGTKFRNIGRLQGGTLWIVTKITSGSTSASQKSIKHLSDNVYLRNSDSHVNRIIKFSSLSYLANWILLS